MARRKNDSFVDVFSGIFFHTTPWLCLPVAAAAFVFILFMVTRTAASTPSLKSLAPMGTIFAGFIAFLILISGATAAMQRLNRKNLLSKQSGIESIRSLSWSKFELLVGEAYRQQGYTINEVDQGGADGGIDLKLHRNGEVSLVQCKQWKTWKVGVSSIREFYGVLMSEKADRGLFITSGVFTDEALAFAAGKPLALIDGDALTALIRPSEGSPAKNHSSSEKIGSPICPSCTRPMTLRTARKGARAGLKFWGCTTFPTCRGTVAA